MQLSLWFTSILIVTCLFISSLIPPLQSPDELAHVSRAYLLAKGKIILDSPNGQSSGGLIDTGLDNYMKSYAGMHGKFDKKVSAAANNTAKEVQWTGEKVYVNTATLGYYFPAAYLPQAIGLKIGKHFKWTVDASYRMARFTALAAIAVILFAAFMIYPVNPLTLAILFLPMMIFQFSSASLDGVSTAIAIFSIAAFLRLMNEKNNFNLKLYLAFALSVVLAATSRTHLLPLLGLLFIVSIYSKKRSAVYIFIGALLFVCSWIIITVKTTIGGSRIAAGDTLPGVALFYLQHPATLLQVLTNTLTDKNYLMNYRDSFIGVLGWLDTTFPAYIYSLFSSLLVSIVILSISITNLKTNWIPRLALLITALAAIAIMFFLLLVQWNPLPAQMIEGIQGRYFFVPMIMIAYAISDQPYSANGVLCKIAFALLMVLMGLTIFTMPGVLLNRYYIG